MKIMKNQFGLISVNGALSLITAFLLTACGGGGSTDSTSSDTSSVTTTDLTSLSIERGPVIGSLVLDAQGKRASNLGNGQYKFESAPIYPIYVSGGYIDVNRDGIIDTNDTKLLTLLSISKSGISKVTMVTTLISNEEIKNELMSVYGLSEEDLYLKPSESLIISAISDILFKYTIENNITSLSSISLTNIKALQVDIQAKILENQNSSGTLLEIATASEIAIVKDLETTHPTIYLSTDEVLDATQEIANRSDIPSLNTSTLTQDQIDDLLFMYQEEKVARDVYIKMYEKWGHNIFNNIKDSEQSHIDAVEALLVKYEIEIPIADTNIGEFELTELQNLYNDLITKGNLSLTDALEVGVMIEEKDITDIVEKMVDVPTDIETVYGNLLSGSYNHLDAFNNVLYK
jgi:hypothetical protein